MVAFWRNVWSREEDEAEDREEGGEEDEGEDDVEEEVEAVLDWERSKRMVSKEGMFLWQDLNADAFVRNSGPNSGESRDNSSNEKRGPRTRFANYLVL